MLTGYGPTTSQRRLIAGQRRRIRRGLNQSAYRTPSAEQMKAGAIPPPTATISQAESGVRTLILLLSSRR
jgi:hypothetical protein